MNNTELWDRVCKTDPNAVKAITGKQYSGNSPKPYYIVRRLTEEFGPCGKGWGFTIVSERMERLTEDDVLHIAHVRFWYESGTSRCELDQMGQTKAVYKTNAGKHLVDEDAPKKSVTDALVKCASYLGFAGDIFSGRWDDSKYVAELRKEFAEEGVAPPVAAGTVPQVGERGAPIGVKAAVLRDGDVMDAHKVGAIAVKIEAEFSKIGPARSAKFIADEKLDDMQLVYLSTLIPTTMMNAITRASRQEHANV